VNNDNVYLLLGAGDGFATMADGKPQYIFSFHDLSHLLPAVTPGDPVQIVPLDQIMDVGMLAAEFPAPTIKVKEGQKLYLNLVNVGMAIRPDLFDPHTVHWHGFPQASSVFDGVPDASLSVNMMASLTYYYNVVRPGTYMYHCHVEATEHMQMGMLGSLYVTPIQDGTPFTYQGSTYTQFAYNDGDGSTGYDVDYPIQMGSFDPAFHDASLNVQPLPFANMVDKYAMLNGRGYPDTVNEDALVPAPDNIIAEATVVRPRGIPNPQRTIRLKASGLLDVDDEYNGLDLLFTSGVNEGVFRKIADYVGSSGEIVLASSLPAAPAVGDTFLIGRVSQRINSNITAVQGERVLLRISNLNVTRFYTLASTIPMQVVGRDARLLRGPSPDGGTTPGASLYYTTNSVNLGGGEAVDAIIDTTGVAPGTYLLYTTNLNYLTNDQEDFGGMMTEITVTAAP
jgi:FtsP/CotA-like multicopper oxidase with cupredoxin domain